MVHEVLDKLDSYTSDISGLLFQLRSLILEVIDENDLGEVRETLKWGEPSYNVKGGSPVRIDWKEKTPDNYYMYFICSTKLVETFKELYCKELKFEGNRAIIFTIGKEFPVEIIRHCILMAMTYKSIKEIPMLGQKRIGT